MKNKTLIIIIAAIFVICALAAVFVSNLSRGGTIAEITLDGEVIETIDLSRVDEPYDLTIECENGYNTVHIENGAISVSDADCPDKICVNTGRITDGVYPIVCLPHKLSISIVSDNSENDGTPDAASGR